MTCAGHSCGDERRPPQFTLRQLLWFVTLFSVVLFLACWAFRQSVGLGVVALTGVIGLTLLVVALKTHNKGLGILGWTGLATAALILLYGCSVVAIGDGWPDLPCDVAVLDGDSLGPLAGAIVEIKEIDPEMPEHPILRRVRGATDATGHVTLKVRLWVSSRSSLFGHSAVVHIPPDLWLEIDFPGYEPAHVPLDSFTGSSCEHRSLPFDTMTVKLTKQKPPNTGQAQSPPTADHAARDD
jgi:hypothetical protein